ncbi:hypothetical protein ebA3255 [Aromatoleum aromaticum EbN1]|nr:hypothetical protein ebA3255 [Aromatoleum aromaticum EbN1]
MTSGFPGLAGRRSAVDHLLDGAPCKPRRLSERELAVVEEPDRQRCPYPAFQQRLIEGYRDESWLAALGHDRHLAFLCNADHLRSALAKISGGKGLHGPSWWTCHQMIVSIHTPRHRGAMRLRLVGEQGPELVSIHAPRHRGAMHQDQDDRQAAGRVSIHAPRHRGAMPSQKRTTTGCTSFQSTPPVTEGRCQARVLPEVRQRSGFNPRPPSPRGDAVRVVRHLSGWPKFQSTPPVTEGRCRSVRRGVHPRTRAFQSTPPVTEGRCFLSFPPTRLRT